MDIIEQLSRRADLHGLGPDAKLFRAAAAELERLRAAIDAFSKATSLPGGPSLAMQQHEPTWEAWKALCATLGHEQEG